MLRIPLSQHRGSFIFKDQEKESRTELFEISPRRQIRTLFQAVSSSVLGGTHRCGVFIQLLTCCPLLCTYWAHLARSNIFLKEVNLNKPRTPTHELTCKGEVHALSPSHDNPLKRGKAEGGQAQIQVISLGEQVTCKMH